MSTVIKVENLSKAYQLGEIGTGTLSRDLERWFARIRGKEDPFLRIGETNDRSSKGDSDVVWSLKDINFEVQQGEVLGIIGRNGAGKSTLLKILSRVTSPTSGSIKVKGRIASLLEVGTGFHPELTGRENIYLNGAILGMRKREIDRKLDEIVEFSGVERYIDTPVKRYSSGMYVRLAFAVAAHLESEILIIDEVLAVGDAEFQQKCLGRMSEVSKGEGRTVLFVSHNMAAIQNLCNLSLLLENGCLVKKGFTPEVVSHYITRQNIQSTAKLSDLTQRQGNRNLFFTHGQIIGIGTAEGAIETFADLKIKLDYQLKDIKPSHYRIDLGINNHLGDRVAWLSSDSINHKFDIKEGSIEFIIQKLPLGPGDYNCNIYSEINNEVTDWVKSVLPFSVAEKDYYQTGKLVPPNQGTILLDYTINEKELC